MATAAGWATLGSNGLEENLLGVRGNTVTECLWQSSGRRCLVRLSLGVVGAVTGLHMPADECVHRAGPKDAEVAGLVLLGHLCLELAP